MLRRPTHGRAPRVFAVVSGRSMFGTTVACHLVGAAGELQSQSPGPQHLGNVVAVGTDEGVAFGVVFRNPPPRPPFPLGHRDVPCGLVPSLYTFTIGALSHILPLFFPRFVPCLLTLWFGVCVWSGRRVEFSCHRTFQAFPTGFWGFSSSARVLLRAAFSVSIHVSVTRRCTTSDARQRQRHTLR